MTKGVIGESPVTVIITKTSGFIIYKYRVRHVILDSDGLHITYVGGMQETVQDVEGYSTEEEDY